MVVQVEQWLTYWLIFGAFAVLESFEEYVVATSSQSSPHAIKI
jgi:hypothetical protein